MDDLKGGRREQRVQMRMRAPGREIPEIAGGGDQQLAEMLRQHVPDGGQCAAVHLDPAGKGVEFLSQVGLDDDGLEAALVRQGPGAGLHRGALDGVGKRHVDAKQGDQRGDPVAGLDQREAGIHPARVEQPGARHRRARRGSAAGAYCHGAAAGPPGNEVIGDLAGAGQQFGRRSAVDLQGGAQLGGGEETEAEQGLGRLAQALAGAGAEGDGEQRRVAARDLHGDLAGVPARAEGEGKRLCHGQSPGGEGTNEKMTIGKRQAGMTRKMTACGPAA